MTLFQNLILFTNHYEKLQEVVEMASFLKYVDLYLTSEWGPVLRGTLCISSPCLACNTSLHVSGWLAYLQVFIFISHAVLPLEISNICCFFLDEIKNLNCDVDFS
jgi:hypothetical protein